MLQTSGVVSDLYMLASECDGCLADLRTKKGRRQFSTDQDSLQMTDDFVSDEAKLLSSKGYRRLPFKTQVITLPLNIHIRNRQTHVMEVVADAVVMADILGLNANLVRSIAIGHDIGHVPGGHPGEHYIAKAMGRKFCHEVMGPIIAQKIERRGEGLNLTFETLDGMMRHSGNTAREGMTQEAWIVRFADKMAYIFADLNDMRRFGYPIPADVLALEAEFGRSQRERTSTAQAALIVESAQAGKVSFMHSEWSSKFDTLRGLMMSLYVRITEQDLERVIDRILNFLELTGISDPFLMYSLMTDRDLEYLSQQTTLNMSHFKNTSLAEYLEHLPPAGQIDLCNPYLDW